MNKGTILVRLMAITIIRQTVSLITINGVIVRVKAAHSVHPKNGRFAEMKKKKPIQSLMIGYRIEITIFNAIKSTNKLKIFVGNMVGVVLLN